jgi:hypothetical protein
LAAHIDDAAGAVDITLLERDELGRPQPGRGPEHDHRPRHRVEPRGESSDLLPRLERPLLRKAPHRVRDAAPGRVDVD